MSQYRRVTMIEDLPEIEPQQGRTREFHVVPNEAGMSLEQPPMPHVSHMPHTPPPLPPQPVENYTNTVHLQPRMITQPSIVDRFVGGPEVMPSYEGYEGLAAANCVGLANHAEKCPICSKLYKMDNRVYLIVIAVLVIIILLLFKKVLDSMH
jgi:hypothetical protein